MPQDVLPPRPRVLCAQVFGPSLKEDASVLVSFATHPKPNLAPAAAAAAAATSWRNAETCRRTYRAALLWTFPRREAVEGRKKKTFEDERIIMRTSRRFLMPLSNDQKEAAGGNKVAANHLIRSLGEGLFCNAVWSDRNSWHFLWTF